jgi:sugar O-acyltransferase (sialic acid O-acetyltransferase NeuD family)
MNLVLLGGGGHAKAVADVARSAGYQVLGVLTPEEAPEQPGLLRLGDDRWIEDCPGDTSFHVAIGPSHGSPLREDIFRHILERGKRLPKIVSPSAFVSASAVFGQGSLIMHRVVVNADARVGENCILNTASVVEHDCIIEDQVHLAPGALLLGGVRIGAGCIVGGGAVVLPGVTVAGGVLIGAGAVVTRSIEEPGGIWSGNPARRQP